MVVALLTSTTLGRTGSLQTTDAFWAIEWVGA